MRLFDSRRFALVVFAAALVSLFACSCGKKSEPQEKTAKEGDSRLLEIARQSVSGPSLEVEAKQTGQALSQAGFVAKAYRDFPSQEVGRHGRMLIYADKTGEKSGGIIYLKKSGALAAPCWHWYFVDMVPDSVERVELNGDGLWDVRVRSTKGQTYTFLQDESFTLMARPRTDWIALNGMASPAAGPGEAMWKCFDGDTTTAWTSPVGGSSAPFIEFYSPFGVERGILILQTGSSGQPRSCAVFADGKEVQSFELESKAAKQMVQLDAEVRSAKTIRLVFSSTHGGADVVSVAEVSLQ